MKRLTNIATAISHPSHLSPLRRAAGMSRALAVALLLAGFGCPAGRAQTMETITNSINGFEAILANVQPDQQVVYVGIWASAPLTCAHGFRSFERWQD